jgi:hypothetical protein
MANLRRNGDISDINDMASMASMACMGLHGWSFCYRDDHVCAHLGPRVIGGSRDGDIRHGDDTTYITPRFDAAF